MSAAQDAPKAAYSQRDSEHAAKAAYDVAVRLGRHASCGDWLGFKTAMIALLEALDEERTEEGR